MFDRLVSLVCVRVMPYLLFAIDFAGLVVLIHIVGEIRPPYWIDVTNIRRSFSQLSTHACSWNSQVCSVLAEGPSPSLQTPVFMYNRIG